MEEGGFGTAIYKTQPKIAHRGSTTNKNAAGKQIITSIAEIVVYRRLTQIY